MQCADLMNVVLQAVLSICDMDVWLYNPGLGKKGASNKGKDNNNDNNNAPLTSDNSNAQPLRTVSPQSTGGGTGQYRVTHGDFPQCFLRAGLKGESAAAEEGINKGKGKYTVRESGKGNEPTS